MQNEQAIRWPEVGATREAATPARIAGAALAWFFLLTGLPLLGAIALVLWIVQGRPIFYRGVRLGRHRRPFILFKFRTLVPDAERCIGARLLPADSPLITPLGAFLRRSRLDELPQLYNVVRGDMNLVGPRPERPEIYDRLCRQVPGYDHRFAVRPGLVGFSQLATPHATPKRIRAFIDNRFVGSRRTLRGEFSTVAIAAWAVMRNVMRGVAKGIGSAARRLRPTTRRQEQRGAERLSQNGATVSWIGASGGGRARLLDVNPTAFRMHSPAEIRLPFPARFRLETEIGRRSGRPRERIAECLGHLAQRRRLPNGGYDYVVRYLPRSSYHLYLVHQYFLRESILSER